MPGPLRNLVDNCHYPLSMTTISVDNDAAAGALVGAELSG